MALASKAVVVAAPMETLIGIIYDYERYPEFLLEIKSAKVARRDNGCVQCEFHARVAGISIDYTLDFVETPPTSLKWTLAKSKRLKVNNGGWLLRAEGDTKTHATYSLEVEVGSFFPKMFQSKLTEMTLPGVLEKFRRRAEAMHSAAGGSGR